MSVQAPAAVVMVRPHSFSPNLETAADNAFQSTDGRGPDEIAAAAVVEFDEAARRLESAGV
ncbi:MAG: citrulline utilization hydrolase CtlX, partial [Anderseniella sp.]